jgi:hypothetical protein
MKTLLKNINKFYKYYNIANPDYSIKVTKSDMYNHDTLMGVYEDIYDNFDYYEDEVALEYLRNLYGELGDYLDDMPSPYKWQSQKMGNIVCTFGEVICQAWYILIHYHTLDLKWTYNKRGF